MSPGDRQRLVGGRGDTRVARWILSAALLSIAAVLAGFTALPTLQARFSSPAFRYANVPFPVSAPGPFHPGDIVPLLITRCVDEASVDSSPIGYLISRALVADDEEARAWTGPSGRVILPPTFTSIHGQGCTEPTPSMLHALPTDVGPGRYHFEGVAQFVAPDGRGTNAYWYSQTFDVVEGP